MLGLIEVTLAGQKLQRQGVSIEDVVGIIPMFLNEADPRPAREQFDEGYSHGGGWRPFNGFTMREDGSIKYPGDPAHPVLAKMHLRDEEIRVYESGWVAIVQKDGSYEICRMD